IYKIFTPSPVTIRFFQALLGALSCFILFKIARSLFGLTAGWVAYGISAFYYPFIQLSGYIMPEMFFIFLFLSFLYFLYRWHDTASPFYLIATGILLGVSALTKEPAILLILFIPFWIAYYSKGAKVKNILIFLISLFLVFTPWVLRNFLVLHSFVPFTLSSGHTLYLGNNPSSTGGRGGDWKLGEDTRYPEDIPPLFSLEADKELKKRAIKFIRENPGRFLQLTGRRIINMWRPYYSDSSRASKLVSGISYLLLMSFGLWGIILSHKEWKKYSPLYFYLIANFFLYAFTISTIRYRYPLIPIIIIFASLPLSYLSKRVYER
ncbi:MAG: hypothetical protein GXO71_07960, partial [Caldiserica bacterium]|nr:hypothetical protein [Caldisericota bacterium]